MIKKSLYSFNTEADTGLDLVPVNSAVYVENYNTTPIQFVLVDKTGITSATTISEFVSGSGSQYKIITNTEGLGYVDSSVDVTLSLGDYLYADTALGAFTVTLPATPQGVQRVTILDHSGSFGANNLTVARNGQTIMGLAEDIVLDVDNKEYRFIFTGTDWRVTQ